MGIVLVLIETTMVWYMDYIGGMEKCPKHTTKMNIVLYSWKKLMVF